MKQFFFRDIPLQKPFRRCAETKHSYSLYLLCWRYRWFLPITSKISGCQDYNLF